MTSICEQCGLSRRRLHAIQALVVIAVFACAISPVLRLLEHGGPPTVTWLIVPVHVDAIQRVMDGGAFPHVLQKHLKGLPPRADGYPPSNIALVVFASVVHGNPRLIGRCPIPSVLFQFGCVPVSQHLRQYASTADSESASKMGAGYHGVFPAVTAALVSGFPKLLIVEAGNAESPKSRSDWHRGKGAFRRHA